MRPDSLVRRCNGRCSYARSVGDTPAWAEWPSSSSHLRVEANQAFLGSCGYFLALARGSSRPFPERVRLLFNARRRNRRPGSRGANSPTPAEGRESASKRSSRGSLAACVPPIFHTALTVLNR